MVEKKIIDLFKNKKYNKKQKEEVLEILRSIVKKDQNQKTKKCFLCHGEHFQKECPFKRKKNLQHFLPYDPFCLGYTHPQTTIKIGEIEIDAKIIINASHSLIKKSMVKKLNLNVSLENNHAILENETLFSEFYVNTPTFFGKRKFNVTFLIVEGINDDCILGYDILREIDFKMQFQYFANTTVFGSIPLTLDWNNPDN